MNDTGLNNARLVLAGVVALGLLAAGCSDPYSSTGPSEDLSFGQLCAPARSGCPDRRVLHRFDAIGANRVDFQLQNLGAAAQITVVASRTADGGLDGGRSDAADAADTASPASSADVVLASRTFDVAADQSRAGRFVQDDLLSEPSFELALDCDDCRATVDYVLGSAPLECRADDDCSSTWVCRQAAGRCVECLTNADCVDDKTCSAQTHACTPANPAGCGQAWPGQPPANPPVGWLVVAGLAGGVILWRRHRQWRRWAKMSAMGGVVFVGVFATGQTPARAANPSAGVNLGVGSRWLAGKLGGATKRGIGLSLGQELRGRYIGGRVQLGASYFLTTQSAPPLSRELTMYSVAVGPQFYIPIGPTELVIGLDYRHVGLVSNSLVRLTGADNNHPAAGGALELRYRLSAVDVTVRSGFHAVFGLDSSVFSVDLALGLTTQ